MKELLKKVINGEINNAQIQMSPISHIEDLLEELGINTNDNELESNGWQVDFWIKYEEKYQLSGSLYYGGFTFTKL